MTTKHDEVPRSPTDRQRWMAALARASVDALESAWRETTDPPGYHLVRPPEVGLAMVRARAGGTGMRFNLGEMTVSRCVVQVKGGAVGYAYVAGSDTRHAELAAVFDALLQDSARRAAIEASVVGPLEREIEVARANRRAQSAPTKVEFFTMVRGDD